MESRVIVAQDQRVDPDDFNNFGLFPQRSLDHVVQDIGTDRPGFRGFNVTGPVGGASVTVGSGRLYFSNGDGTQVYFNDDEGGYPLNLLPMLPLSTLVLVTIAVVGQERPTNSEPRTFLTDAATRATIAKPTPTEMRRRAEISAIPGRENANPQAPALAANLVAVAYVLLGVTGIVSVTAAVENRLPSVRDNSDALAENAVWRARAGTKIDTLGSDIAALAAGQRGFASDIFVREVAGDVSRLKERLQLSSAYSSYDADHFLTAAKSRMDHVDMLATVMEGIRFPPANSADAQLGVLNQFDARINNQNFFILPAYKETPRIALLEGDSEVSLAQYSFTTQTIIQRSKTVTRTRYGTPFSVCTNYADWWATATVDYWNNTVYRGDAVYEIENITTPIPDHPVMRLKQVWTDTTQEPYWDLNTTTTEVSGSILSQSRLITQDGWLTSLDFLFTKIAVTGDVRVVVTECTNAAPDLSKALGMATIQAANLKASPTPTRCPIVPILLRKGQRIGVFLISPGNHFVAITVGNKDGQGSLFHMTDGALQVGSLSDDLCMGLNFAQFETPYLDVQLNPLQLAGGIAAVDFQMPTAKPDGTSLVFSVMDPANGQWKPLTADSGGTALIGLPPLVQFKATLIGTTDLMPGFGVGSDARVTTTRPRPDNRHISAVRTLPAPCQNISLIIRLENWRGAPHHTHSAKLITGPLLTTGVGDTLTNPVLVQEVPAGDDPLNAIIRTYTFSLAAPVTRFAIRQEGNTDNVLTTFHVAERIDIDTP